MLGVIVSPVGHEDCNRGVLTAPKLSIDVFGDLSRFPCQCWPTAARSFLPKAVTSQTTSLVLDSDEGTLGKFIWYMARLADVQSSTMDLIGVEPVGTFSFV